jgi:hypothetical protein
MPQNAKSDLTGVPYESAEFGIALRLPAADYTINESYAHQVNPDLTLPGIQFTIPEARTLGTNLSADTSLSIERRETGGACTADAFLDGAHTPTDEVHNEKTYSVVSVSGAGAGNRYEEIVYAVPGTRPCVGIRYFLHYTALENYAPGTKTEFDKAVLIAEFDAIRDSVVVSH